MNLLQETKTFCDAISPTNVQLKETNIYVHKENHPVCDTE